jgi:hypothetical protein
LTVLPRETLPGPGQQVSRWHMHADYRARRS